jgi:hypothetical protein
LQLHLVALINLLSLHSHTLGVDILNKSQSSYRAGALAR